MSNNHVSSLALLCLTICCAGAQAAVSISGVVASAQGPVASAHVGAMRLVQTFRGAANPVTSVEAGEDGTFRFDGLEPGAYQICVSALKSDLLDPCEWAETPVKLTLGDGEGRTGVTVPMERGVWMEVEVEDVGRQYRDREHPGVGAFVLVGVRSADGLFHPAQETREDERVRTYRLLVPYEADVELVVRGDRVQLEDAGKKRLGGIGDALKMRTKRGDKPKTVSYRVKGVE